MTDTGSSGPFPDALSMYDRHGRYVPLHVPRDAVPRQDTGNARTPGIGAHTAGTGHANVIGWLAVVVVGTVVAVSVLAALGALVAVAYVLTGI
jgi:hypothetical protein